MRIVEYYQTAEGKCPVGEFLRSLGNKDREKALWVFRLIERIDQVSAEFFKKLVDTEEIWECRIHTATGAYRVFSFFFEGGKLILTHGYSKKRWKTDRREIVRAEQYRRDYLSRFGRK